MKLAIIVAVVLALTPAVLFTPAPQKAEAGPCISGEDLGLLLGVGAAPLTLIIPTSYQEFMDLLKKLKIKECDGMKGAFYQGEGAPSPDSSLAGSVNSGSSGMDSNGNPVDLPFETACTTGAFTPNATGSLTGNFCLLNNSTHGFAIFDVATAPPAGVTRRVSLTVSSQLKTDFTPMTAQRDVHGFRNPPVDGFVTSAPLAGALTVTDDLVNNTAITQSANLARTVVSFPLCSGDAQDLCLKPGNVVGFCATIESVQTLPSGGGGASSPGGGGGEVVLGRYEFPAGCQSAFGGDSFNNGQWIIYPEEPPEARPRSGVGVSGGQGFLNWFRSQNAWFSGTEYQARQAHSMLQTGWTPAQIMDYFAGRR